MQMRNFALASTMLSFCTLTGFGGHEGDFEVGIDPQLNQVKIEFDPNLFPWLLPPSEWPAAIGFALDDPGFVSLEPNEVIPGVFELLNPDALIALRVVATNSPEMKIWNPVGPGEPGFQILGDDLWTIGSQPFDDHPVWHIDTADPAYHPGHSPWAVSFQLVDLAGHHLESDVVTVTYTPEPAASALLALATLGFGARRRS